MEKIEQMVDQINETICQHILNINYPNESIKRFLNLIEMRSKIIRVNEENREMNIDLNNEILRLIK